MPRSQVVITGMGVVSSIGLGRDAFWNSLLAGRSGLRPLAERSDDEVVPLDDTQPPGLRIGGPIVDFEPKQWIRPRKAMKVMCREIQTSFAASQMALEDAGLEEILPAEVGGVITPEALGTVFGCEILYGSPDELVDAFRGCLQADGSVRASDFGNAAMRGIMPLWLLKYLPNMPACHVGISINAQGPNNTLVLGDISGPAAVIEATSYLRRGIAEIVFCGASGSRVATSKLASTQDLPVAEIADPSTASSRPHDPCSTGVIGGEGAGTIVLETAASAARRGARPLARILAAASRFTPSLALQAGNRSAALNARLSRGSDTAIEAAIKAVLEQAEIDPARVGLVVSHAMGDPQIDEAFGNAIDRCLPGVAEAAPIASLGHVGAASGMLELITGIAALAERTVPPTLNAESAATNRGLQTSPKPLPGDTVLCICQNSEGNTSAVLLG